MAITLNGSSGITSSNRIDTQTGFRQLNGTTQTAGIFPERVITGAGTSDDLCIFTETGYDLHVMTGGTIDKKLSVDSAGRVTMPYQPYASVSNSASGTGTIYGSAVINNGGHYNSSTGAFTCPVAGYYAVGGAFYTNGTTTQEIQVFVNGVIRLNLNNLTSNMSYWGSACAGLVYCNANDAITFYNNKGSVRGATADQRYFYLVG